MTKRRGETTPTSRALNPSKGLVSTLVDIPEEAHMTRESTGGGRMGVPSRGGVEGM